MGMIGKLQNVIQSDPRVKVEWPKIMEAYGGLIDLPQAGEFISIDEQAKPIPPAPDPNTVTMSNGQTLDASDLVKLFSNLTDINVRNAALQSFGLPPETSPAPQPVTNKAGVFNDPSVADAAQQLLGN